MEEPKTPLDAHMRARKMTDQALADRVGVSRPHITKIRCGTRRPSIAIARKIAHEAEISLDDVADGAVQ